MVSGGTFLQASQTARLALMRRRRIILAADVTQDTNDKHQTVSMVKRMKTNTGGNPKRLTADSGYYNQDQIQQLRR